MKEKSAAGRGRNSQCELHAMTPALRRELWNELADLVSLAANVLIGARKINDFEAREFLHDELMAISLMMRRTGAGRPKSLQETTAGRATRHAFERTFEMRRKWREQSGKRYVPAKKLERWIEDECDKEFELSGTRPIPAAVGAMFKRGWNRSTTDRQNHSMHLQRAVQLIEQDWLARRNGHRKLRNNC